MKKFLIPIATIFLLTGCASDNSFVDQIDKDEQDCIKKTSSTEVMLECSEKAKTAWEKEINEYYNKLLEILSEDSKKELKKSQKLWEKYKENEFNFTAQMLEEMQGTMFENVKSGYWVEILKQRALQLKSYYETVTF